MRISRGVMKPITHLLRSLPHEHESLGIGDKLGGIKRLQRIRHAHLLDSYQKAYLLEVIDELLLIALKFSRGTIDDFACPVSLLLDRG
jgi:hypothetical protein